MTKPILTIEAKAPQKDIGLYKEGWSRLMDIKDIGRRGDVLHQVFLQLINIERLNDHPYAFLSNGRDFSLFTLRRETEHRYNMGCLYSTTISDVLKDDEAVSNFRRFLSRNTYCEEDCKLLAVKGKDFPPTAMSTRGKAILSGQLLESPDEQRAIELPDNWHETFRTWAKSFEADTHESDPGFQYFQSLCDPQKLTPLEKMSFFEVMRFCHILGPTLPSGWRFVFEKGKEIANINIKLCPSWLPTELRKMSGSSLFQITPNGRRPGIIWINASDSQFEKQQKDTPLWHFYRIKLDMNRKLPRNPCVYQSGMVERLISLCGEVVGKLISAGLISESLSSGG